jgi:hypothetical protein
MDAIDTMSDANNLLHAVERLDKASGWKASTQKIFCNRLRTIRKLQQDLRSGNYTPLKGTSFCLREHGRLRLIKALRPVDLCAQHSLCDSVLFPQLQKYLIHDNGASQKGKGIAFTRKRFKQHLMSFIRKHGRDGYILLIDFRKFFDNIEHEKLIAAILDKIPEERLGNLFRSLLLPYRIDVSFSDDPDIIHKVFSALDYQSIPESMKTGERFMPKSLGIGAPISQISGVFFPTRIDTYCKHVLRLKYYDVYMDDRAVMHQSKEFLRKLLDDIDAIAHSMGLHINRRKTQITKISHGFTFLKTKYIVTETGKIVQKIPRDVVVRQRRKMKKLAVFVSKGEMTASQFKEQYQSWRGDKKRYNVTKTLRTLDTQNRRLEKWIRHIR